MRSRSPTQPTMEEVMSVQPVTALEFCSHAGTQLLLAGEGSYLKVFSESGRLVCCREVLPLSRIHGIVIFPHLHEACPGEGAEAVVQQVGAVFGQKQFCMFQLFFNESGDLRLCSSAVTELDDWVLHLVLLSSSVNTLEDLEAAALTAHNAVVFFRPGKERPATAVFSCEVKCVLYCGRMVVNNCQSGLVVVSGTVFNQVLLWQCFPTPCAQLQPVGSDGVKVQVVFKGHEGVIFSARLSEDQSKLVSVSDDRSIRLWQVPQGWQALDRTVQGECLAVLYGHTARVWDAVLLLLPMDAVGSATGGRVVSVGEDATCRVWQVSLAGGGPGGGPGGSKCLRAFQGHRGKSVWSLAVDSKRELVATGGADCSIRVHRLSSTTAEAVRESSSMELALPDSLMPDAPRSVLLCEGKVFCLTSQGYLLHTCAEPYTSSTKSHTSSIKSRTSPDAHTSTSAVVSCGKQEFEWTIFHHYPCFSGYSVLAAAPSLCCQCSFLAVGNLQGCVKLLATAGSVKNHEWQAHEGKVFSLTWTVPVSPGPGCRLFSCGPEGSVVCWSVELDVEHDQFRVVRLACFALPHSKHRWVNCVQILPPGCGGHDVPPTGGLGRLDQLQQQQHTAVILGDRRGSLHMYKAVLEPSSIDEAWERTCQSELVFSLKGLHGPNGVTSIALTSVSEQSVRLTTAGRDGYCREIVVDGDRLCEVSKYRPVKGMDWIEKVLSSPSDSDNIVVGFHANNLVLHSTLTNRDILTLPCGGGHRSYALNSLEELLAEKVATVAYIKASAVYLAQVRLESLNVKPVFQPSLVGQEIHTLKVIHFHRERGDCLLALGSEDTTITLVRMNLSDNVQSLQLEKNVHIQTVQGHIAGVRALASSHSAPPSCLEEKGQRGHTVLFSGGARATLKAWLIDERGEGGGAGIQLIGDHHLHHGASVAGRRKGQRERLLLRGLPECRVMSLACVPISSTLLSEAEAAARVIIKSPPEEEGGREGRETLHYVAAGCSDGIIRQYLFSETRHKFTALAQLSYHNHCLLILKCLLLTHTHTSCALLALLLSAATDGLLAFWPVVHHSILGRASHECESLAGGDCRDKPLASIRLHQSGINDISTVHVDGNTHRIATVGDDNALCITECTVVVSAARPCPPEVRVTKLLSIPHAHSSSITGVVFMRPNVCATSSVDQRLCVWRIVASQHTAASHTSAAELVHSVVHGVQDASCLGALVSRNTHCFLLVCGIGMACYHMKLMDEPQSLHACQCIVEQ